MLKNKLITFILIFTVAFSTLFSFSVSNADESDMVIFDGQMLSKQEIVDRLKLLQTENPFEMTVSGICIGVGDFVLDYLVYLFQDEITIDRLVFNKVPSLNANFFEMNNKGIVPDTTEILCSVINDWYGFFKGLAIVAYLMVLVLVGTKILLRNSTF